MLNLNLKSWWSKRVASKKRGDKKKRPTHLTMMVVPHGHGAAVKNYCIPMWLVKGFLALSLTCILIVGYFVTGFFYLRYVAAENQILKEINSAQEKEINELKGMAGNMRSKLEALMQLDQEVRAKMGLASSSQDKALKIESSRAVSRYQFMTMGLGSPGEGLGQHGYVSAMVPFIEDTSPAADPLAASLLSSTDTAATGGTSPIVLATDQEINTLEDLKVQLAQMDALITQQTENMTLLSSEIDKQKAIEAAIPDFWPFSGRITCTYGWRKNPFTKKGSEFHDGVDIAGPYGSPIRAAGDGVVTFAGWKGAWGRVVVISHGYGYVTQYAHNSSLVVKTGDKVKKGQVIARLGNTGRSTGPHVHFGVAYKGKWINPFDVTKR